MHRRYSFVLSFIIRYLYRLWYRRQFIGYPLPIHHQPLENAAFFMEWSRNFTMRWRE